MLSIRLSCMSVTKLVNISENNLAVICQTLIYRLSSVVG